MAKSLSFYQLSQLIEMAPHAEFHQVPPDLSFLQGDVDLGFENLGLSPQQQYALKIAFEGDGAAVPGTAHKMRQIPNANVAVVEPATGKEPLLPENWKQGAYTLAGNDFAYIGKKVRRNDQLPPGFEPANDPGSRTSGMGISRFDLHSSVAEPSLIVAPPVL